MSVTPRLLTATLFVATLVSALPAHAHKMWMQPSKTVLSVGQWITVDAAASTDPFARDHRPLGLDALTITAPDGAVVAPAHPATGELRSSFDLKLEQAGTYKLAMVRDGVSASWTNAGKHGRWPPRGQPFSADGLAKTLPATATNLKVVRMLSRLETFVTAGSPTTTVFDQPLEGLTMQPLSAVNDLYADEPAQLRFVIDGKPAAGLAVELIADGIRYRDAVDAIELTTDAQGRIEIEWPRAGFYWLNVSAEDRNGGADVPYRRLSYTAVLEVLNP
jgi:uncharacterized GH25 family protein